MAFDPDTALILTVNPSVLDIAQGPSGLLSSPRSSSHIFTSNLVDVIVLPHMVTAVGMAAANNDLFAAELSMMNSTVWSA